MSSAVFTPDLRRRLDATGPRGIPYPIADRLDEGCTAAHHEQAPPARAAPALAIDAHLPCCERSAADAPVGVTHAQKAKTLDTHGRAFHDVRPATVRGLALDAGAALRRRIIPRGGARPARQRPRAA
jgi:hypothetical protein